MLCTDIYLFFRMANHVDCVPRYLKYVVDMGIYLYGPTYPSINVHSLLHIVDDYQVKKPFLVHLFSLITIDILIDHVKNL